jgi:hypothetical protein
MLASSSSANPLVIAGHKTNTNSYYEPQSGIMPLHLSDEPLVKHIALSCTRNSGRSVGKMVMLSSLGLIVWRLNASLAADALDSDSKLVHLLDINQTLAIKYPFRLGHVIRDLVPVELLLGLVLVRVARG